jgi:hypothetical protein
LKSHHSVAVAVVEVTVEVVEDAVVTVDVEDVVDVDPMLLVVDVPNKRVEKAASL